ncbi:MAG: glycosyltransferase family 4 protein [Armatimonas sp.]
MKFGLLVGGWMDDTRREATANGERPRADIFLLEERLNCHAFDFSWLEARCATEPLTRTLRKLIGWSATLAVRALPELSKCEAIYCSGEDVGLPLGWLLAFTKRQRIVMRMEQPEYGSSMLKRALWRALLRGALRRVNQVFCRTEAHVEFLKALGYARAAFTPETTDAEFWTINSNAHASPCPNAPYPPVMGAPDSVSPAGSLSPAADTPITLSPNGVGEGVATKEPGEGQVPQNPLLLGGRGACGSILSAGLEERDYPTLIQAVEGTDWQLTVAAGSPWSKFSFASEAPPENVTVAKFAQKELREQYAQADVVVLSVNPTPRACGMNVVLEAWAMGVPVIATDTPGLKSYLMDGENALLVPPKDPVALQKALEMLRADRKLSHKLTENGKRCIASWGNLESYVGIIESALRAPSSVSCGKNPASISSDPGY